MRLSQEQVDGILERFRIGLDPDEREDVVRATPAAVEEVNREIGRLARPTPDDVAEAMWEAIPGLAYLDDERLDELTDVIDDRWRDIVREGA